MIHLIHVIAKNITNEFFVNRLETEIDKAKFEYGLVLFIEIVLDIIGFAILGMLFGNMALLAVYLIAFAVARMNAGGYHAKTFLGCFITIAILALASIHIVSHIGGDSVLYIILAGISGAIIVAIAPVDSAEKPLGTQHRRRLRKKTLNSILSLVVLCILLNALGFKAGTCTICMAIIGQMLSMMPVYLSRRRNRIV